MSEFKNILSTISIFICVIILSTCYGGPVAPGGDSPDLTVSITTPLGDLSPDSPFDLNVTVFNNGDTESAESRLSLYLSSNSSLELGIDTLLSDHDIPSISAASSTAQVISQSLSSSGTWYIIASADSAEAVTEKDETNNQSGTVVVINPAGTKDLQSGEVSIDNDPLNDGGSCTLSTVLTNQGSNTVTETFSVSFYISADSDFTPAGDTYLGEEAVTHDFAEFSSMNLSSEVTIPDGLNLNQCVYFYADVDITDAVSESDENNISGIDEAAVALIYDDEDASRTYDLIIETFPPKGTVETNPDTWLGLYDNTGTEIDTNDTGGTYSADGYSEIAYTVTSPGSIYYVLMWGNATGPYALSVRTGDIELRYFSIEFTTDPYEPDDANTGNVPDSPVALGIGEFSNRYSESSDWDWFVIELP